MRRSGRVYLTLRCTSGHSELVIFAQSERLLTGGEGGRPADDPAGTEETQPCCGATSGVLLNVGILRKLVRHKEKEGHTGHTHTHTNAHHARSVTEE